MQAAKEISTSRKALESQVPKPGSKEAQIKSFVETISNTLHQVPNDLWNPNSFGRFTLEIQHQILDWSDGQSHRLCHQQQHMHPPSAQSQPSSWQRPGFQVRLFIYL